MSGFSDVNSSDPTAGLSKEVGMRLRERREELSLSLRQAAKDSQVSAGHLSDIENGRSHASLPVLLRLGRILQLPLAELLPRLGGHHVRQEHTADSDLGIQLLSHPDLHLEVIAVGIEEGDEHQVKLETGEDLFAYLLGGRVAIDIDGRGEVLDVGDAADVERAELVTFHAIAPSKILICRGEGR